MSIAHNGLFNLIERCNVVSEQARHAPAPVHGMRMSTCSSRDYNMARRAEQDMEVGFAQLLASIAFVMKHRKLNQELIESQTQAEFEKLESLNRKVG